MLKATLLFLTLTAACVPMAEQKPVHAEFIDGEVVLVQGPPTSESAHVEALRAEGERSAAAWKAANAKVKAENAAQPHCSGLVVPCANVTVTRAGENGAPNAAQWDDRDHGRNQAYDRDQRTENARTGRAPREYHEVIVVPAAR